MHTNIAKTLTKTIVEEHPALFMAEFKSILKPLKNSLEVYCREVSQLRDQLSQYPIQTAQPQKHDKESYQARAIEVREIRNKIKEASFDIRRMLLDGYKLIQLTREVLTGQQIDYQIGFELGRGKNKKFYNGKTSMEEILKNAKISLAATQEGGTLDYVLKVANKTTLIAQGVTVTEANSDQTNLLSRIRAYSQRSHMRLNNGHIYEIYANFDKNGNYSPSTQQLHHMAKVVLSNTDKFYHKGDIDLTQIKGLLGSNPSIVNFSSIFLAVQALYKIIKDLCDMKISETEAYAMLQSFFHFDQKIGDVSQDVVKMAVDEIKTLFKNLPNSYYINTT